ASSRCSWSCAPPLRFGARSLPRERRPSGPVLACVSEIGRGEAAVTLRFRPAERDPLDAVAHSGGDGVLPAPEAGDAPRPLDDWGRARDPGPFVFPQAGRDIGAV